MIAIVQQKLNNKALDLIFMALVRSVSRNQVSFLNETDIGQQGIDIYVLVNPSESVLNKTLSLGNIKVIIFGRLPESFISERNISHLESDNFTSDCTRSPLAETYSYSESKGYVEYTNLASTLFDFSMKRALERFDFTDEWNNLGYGRIRFDDSIWSISDLLVLPSENSLSDIKVHDTVVATYAGIFDDKNVSICWFNREVGPVDSPDWHLVEKFIASHRSEHLPCAPVLLEVPQGYDSAVTMRLDCDEDIESCRTLWDAYKHMDIPFSIAIHTTNLADAKHHSIVKEMHKNDVAILSHTATHAPNWGGSYESALFEARESAAKIKELINEDVKYAVSPFHQAPEYALRALSDSGYRGCIGGIIRNDPEFLIHCGGNVDGQTGAFIGHSQQVMLHGDCILKEGDPLRVYKDSFKLSQNTFTLFGYLDHPFSERYSYGWGSEEQRLSVHRELITYIKSESENVLFLSENDALDFIYDKSFLNADILNGNVVLAYEEDYISLLSYLPKILYKNKIFDNIKSN